MKTDMSLSQGEYKFLSQKANTHYPPTRYNLHPNLCRIIYREFKTDLLYLYYEFHYKAHWMKMLNIIALCTFIHLLNLFNFQGSSCSHLTSYIVHLLEIEGATRLLNKDLLRWNIFEVDSKITSTWLVSLKYWPNKIYVCAILH